MNRKHVIRIAVLVLVLAGIYVLLTQTSGQLSFENVQQQLHRIQDWYGEHPVLFAGGFVLFYIITAALGLPFAGTLTILAGAIFHFVVGVVLVSFASVCGATLAMLFTRFLVGEWCMNRYGVRLSKIQQAIDRNGWLYLFIVRLIPIVPFFLINIAAGFTKMKILTYTLVSFLGMLPMTMVFVYAGKKFSEITSAGDLLSVELFLILVTIAFLPLFGKWLLGRAKGRYTDSV